MKPEKKATLVVSFGTSHRGTLIRNIAAIEQEIANAMPQREIRRAFTSGMVLRKLRAVENLHIYTVEQALQKLVAEGYGDIVIQPTLVVNGHEFAGIALDAAPFRNMANIRLGTPLLTATEDYQAVAQILSAAYPQREGTAVCLMGHGAAHAADAAYAALDYHFKGLGRADIFVGTVEGFPDLETVTRHVEAYGAGKVVLAPLMVTAGEHAVNDMAGDSPGSWKSTFARMGREVTCELKGLGEYPAVRRLYAQHALAAEAGELLSNRHVEAG